MGGRGFGEGVREASEKAGQTHLILFECVCVYLNFWVT